ncbi:hypothetical protein F5Y16DRAFT_385704 [Xylariaceae sp. FL0255]|nr:hypothetical protein F5Y16DRAFT_385704 [Xylariaceae sp. FL0255]
MSMLATRQRARIARTAKEEYETPLGGQVPLKPTTSWVQNLRTSVDSNLSPKTRRSRKQEKSIKPLKLEAVKHVNLPSVTAPVTVSPNVDEVSTAGTSVDQSPPAPRTVEVKNTSLAKLLSPERGTIHDLGIQAVSGQFSDKEAEKQYKEFIRQLRVWSLDFAHPEKDPLHKFSDYHTLTFKRVYRKVEVPGKEPELKPYICFIGFNDEDEVKRGHAELSTKRVHRRHCPLLGLCYSLDWEQLSDVPTAQLLRGASEYTLCGSLATIGEGDERRIVTIGGLVTDGEVTWALTAGHILREVPRGRGDHYTLMESDLDASDYDKKNIARPLVIIPLPVSSLAVAKLSNFDDPNGTTPVEIGQIDLCGDDWSLIRLEDDALLLPNCVKVGDQEPAYLLRHAESLPQDGTMATVLGGVTGPSSVQLFSEISPMRLPGGKWIDTWVAEAQSMSQLQRGDSGSWVVDVNTGTVYGHVLSQSGTTISIMSLLDIFREVSEKCIPMRVELAQPFVPLARLSRTSLEHLGFLSVYYAEQALQVDVVRTFGRKSVKNALTIAVFMHWVVFHLDGLVNVDDSLYREFRDMVSASVSNTSGSEPRGHGLGVTLMTILKNLIRSTGRQ